VQFLNVTVSVSQCPELAVVTSDATLENANPTCFPESTYVSDLDVTSDLEKGKRLTSVSEVYPTFCTHSVIQSRF
jgi:hypothetical protein